VTAGVSHAPNAARPQVRHHFCPACPDKALRPSIPSGTNFESDFSAFPVRNLSRDLRASRRSNPCPDTFGNCFPGKTYFAVSSSVPRKAIRHHHVSAVLDQPCSMSPVNLTPPSEIMARRSRRRLSGHDWIAEILRRKRPRPSRTRVCKCDPGPDTPLHAVNAARSTRARRRRADFPAISCTSGLTAFVSRTALIYSRRVPVAGIYDTQSTRLLPMHSARLVSVAGRAVARGHAAKL